MDSQLRAYVWGQVFAAKLTIHGFTVADAAVEADAALKEFDKRAFDGLVAERDAVIVRLEGEVEVAHAQNEKDTAALLASVAEVSRLNGEIAKLGDTVAAQAAEIAQRAEEVIAPKV